MTARQVWVNGAVCDENDARVSPFDHGLLTGDGVFETVRAYAGRPFALDRHLARLKASADGLGLEVPDFDLLRSAVREVLAANELGEARVRITVTGGRSPLGSVRGADGPLVIVAAAAHADYEPDVSVAIAPWPKSEHSAVAGLKTTSYAENVVALAWARERGAGEAIFTNLAGNVCEGTGTNLFVVLEGRLATPPLSAGCLAGVTRALIVEELKVEESDFPPEALAEATEAFLSSTTREVHPIRSVDGRELPECPGPETLRAAAAVRALVEAEIAG
ncbi:MAG TPA: aminotransferase class IV [Acidimicrobiales bacterium]|nr:aminotransferase class IV [Acidimicrobiales bacterium]